MNPIPNLTGTATIPPGSVNLAPYPALVYAPGQHGDFIAFAHNGKPVEELAEGMTHEMAWFLDAQAQALGISFSDVCDALKYLRDQKRI